MPFETESTISAKQLAAGEHRLDTAIIQFNCWDQTTCGPAKAALTAAGHAALEGNINGLETAIKNSPDSNVFISNLNQALDVAGVPLTIDTAGNNHAILIGLPDSGAKGAVIDMDLTKGTAQAKEAIFAGQSVIFAADAASDLNVDAAAHKIVAKALDASEEAQEQNTNSTIIKSMAQANDTFGSGLDPKEALKKEDANLQSGTSLADAQFDELWSRRQFVNQKMDEAFPQSAQQQARTLEDTVHSQMAKLPDADVQTLQNIVSGQADGNATVAWLTNHKDITDTLASLDTLMQPVEPWQRKQEMIQQAADTKVAAHMLYAAALATAGDPRAKAQFNAAFKGFLQSDIDRYANDPDVVSVGKLVGATVPAGPYYDLGPRRMNF